MRNVRVATHLIDGEAVALTCDCVVAALRCFLAGMRAKFGLLRQLPGDADLVKGMIAAMQCSGADFTDCFRELSRVSLPQPDAVVAATPGACH